MTGLRKQYCFRPSPQGLLSWEVDRIEPSATLPRRRIPIDAIVELDEAW